MKLKISDPIVKDIVKRAFPEYRGRTVKMAIWYDQMLYTWWNEGSKSEYALFDMADGNLRGVTHTFHPLYDAGITVPPKFALPENHILVEHRIFCGKDVGITIWVRPENAPKFIEYKEENKGAQT
jgi:hypothetical protein